jgi:hypothetical protein
MRAGGGALTPGKAMMSTTNPGLFNEGSGSFVSGPEKTNKFQDLSAEGPGGWKFGYWEDKDLEPHESMEMKVMRIPGPGEPGFIWTEQKNLIPQEQERAAKEKRQKTGPRENKKSKLK